MCRLLYTLFLIFVVSTEGRIRVHTKNPLVSMSKDFHKYLHGPFGSSIPLMTEHQQKIIEYSDEKMREDLNFMDLSLIDEASSNLRAMLTEMVEQAFSRTEHLLSVSKNNSELLEKASLFKELRKLVKNGSDWRMPEVLKKEFSTKQKSFCSNKNEFFPILRDHGYSDYSFSCLYHIYRTYAIVKTVYSTFELFIKYPAIMSDDERTERHDQELGERYEEVMSCLENVNQWREKQSFQTDVLFTEQEKKAMLSEEVVVVPSRHSLFSIGDDEELITKYHFLTFRLCGSSNRKNFYVPHKFPVVSFNNSHCSVSVIRYSLEKPKTIESWDLITDNFITTAMNLKRQRKSCPGRSIAQCFASRMQNADETGLLAVVVTDVGHKIVSNAGPMEQVSVEMEILNKKRRIVGFFGVQLETILI